MLIKIKKTSATTMIEILTYFTIFAIVTLVMLSFAIQILNANRVSSNLHELNSNLEFITEKITTTIRLAANVDGTSSIFDNDVGALSLIMDNAAISPTRFYLSNNDVFLAQGTSAPIQLNSDFVEFTSLRFERVTYPQAPDQIIIDAVAFTPHGNNQQLEKELNSHSAVSLRR